MEAEDEEDGLLGNGGVGGWGSKKKHKRGKKKRMEELSDEQQAVRRAALAVKRNKKRELVRDMKARGHYKKAADKKGSDWGQKLPAKVKPKATGGKGKGKGKVGATKLPKEGVSAAPLPQPPSERLEPTTLRITREEGATARGDVEAVKRIFIEAAFNRPSSSTEGGPPAHIREVIFSNGAVSVRVGDVASRRFATAALEGSGFRAETLEGHLRMVFNVSATWSGFTPERLMGILASHNPGLPEEALRFVSWVKGGSGISTVFVDVSRVGLSFLRGRDCKLLALLETVKLRPAEK